MKDQYECCAGEDPLCCWPVCADHREIAHDAAGSEEMTFCNRCGWNRVLGERLAHPNGGWGSP